MANAFSEKLKDSPLERKSRAYLALQRIRLKHSGTSLAAADRVRIEFSASARADAAVFDEVTRFFIDHAMSVDALMPGGGQVTVGGQIGAQRLGASARQPNEGEESHPHLAAASGHIRGASSPSPHSDNGHGATARPPSSSPSGAGTGGPTPAQRAGAIKAAASQAATVFELQFRDGSKLGNIFFEDMESITRESLFESILLAMLRSEYPDAYGRVRDTVSEGQLERLKILALNQAKRSAPKLAEED